MSNSSTTGGGVVFDWKMMGGDVGSVCAKLTWPDDRPPYDLVCHVSSGAESDPPGVWTAFVYRNGARIHESEHGSKRAAKLACEAAFYRAEELRNP